MRHFFVIACLFSAALLQSAGEVRGQEEPPAIPDPFVPHDPMQFEPPPPEVVMPRQPRRPTVTEIVSGTTFGVVLFVVGVFGWIALGIATVILEKRQETARS